MLAGILTILYFILTHWVFITDTDFWQAVLLDLVTARGYSVGETKKLKSLFLCLLQTT